jgi:hypothetical protein
VYIWIQCKGNVKHHITRIYSVYCWIPCKENVEQQSGPYLQCEKYCKITYKGNFQQKRSLDYSAKKMSQKTDPIFTVCTIVASAKKMSYRHDTDLQCVLRNLVQGKHSPVPPDVLCLQCEENLKGSEARWIFEPICSFLHSIFPLPTQGLDTERIFTILYCLINIQDKRNKFYMKTHIYTFISAINDNVEPHKM